MNIYINKWCSGFFWYSGEVSHAKDDMLMEPLTKADVESMSPILSGLKTKGLYETCLVKEEKKYILSLKELPEHSHDDIGRKSSISVILLSEEGESLWKILFSYLQDKQTFSDKMSRCFIGKIKDGKRYVKYKTEELTALLNSCNKSSLSAEATDLMNKKLDRLLFVNTDSRDVMENIGFSENEIVEAEHNGLAKDKWIDFVPTPDPAPTPEIEKLKKDLEESKKHEEELQTELASSKKELEDMKSEAMSLRKRIEDFKNVFILKNKELMRYKLASIVLGVASILFFLLYLIK